ncbi:hypothetical protein SCLCIDRAFT_1097269 [Scleroderma citrinum Foug A]|uniref:Uncharacterized protein n=1 Tax=Scleroderma citrinum Foug A TaxID=1036808 RepID=A0A0C3A141_9AGAM|nr:hypothetical protein SCLCIDRAFT_1097269 [Scleroderma citrinum Foug A]
MHNTPHNIFSYFRRVTASKSTPHVEVSVVEDTRSPRNRNSQSGLFGFLTRIYQVCHPVPELGACPTCESHSGLLLGFHLRGTNVVTLRVGRIITHCHHHALKYLKLMGLQLAN